MSTENSIKESNPKDAIGVTKVGLSYVPMPVLMELALALQEGALKYGAHNYRVIGVRGSVYYDAAMRHLAAWWEGEDLDAQSGANLHHISKAIASLTVLRDAMLAGQFYDDRPPKTADGWIEKLSEKVVVLAKAFPNPVPRYTQQEKK